MTLDEFRCGAQAKFLRGIPLVEYTSQVQHAQKAWLIWQVGGARRWGAVIKRADGSNLWIPASQADA